jgi:hypothetical protein
MCSRFSKKSRSAVVDFTVQIWENLAVDDILSAIQSGDTQAVVEYFTALSLDKHRQFVEQVGSLKSETAAYVLTALYPIVEQKDLKKLVKKLLFHLKTQGIQVDEPVVAGDSVLKKVEVTKEQMALGSNYDHEGIRVLLLAFELRKKQFVFTHVTQRFAEGLVDMMSAPIDKQGLDGLISDYRSKTRSSMVLVDISPSFVMHLIEEASKGSGKKADEVRGLKRLATGLTGDVRTFSDIYHLQAAPSGSEVSWQQVVASSLFEPFSLSWKEMEEDRKEYNSIAHPQIVLPPHIVEEKRMVYLKGLAALDRMKPLQLQLSRAIEYYAYLFFRRGEHASYTALIGALQSTDALDAVIQFFLKKSLEQKEETPQQAPGLIVNPYTRKP